MKTPLSSVRLDVFADYNQFYIWDPDLPDVMAPEDYTDQDVSNRVKVCSGVVVVQPVRNMTVPVEIQIYDADPEFHFNEWQHIVEAPLQLTKGRIEIHECTGGSLASLPAPSLNCMVRALFKGLDTLSENGLEGKDFYRVQIFPSDIIELRIIKQWTE
ncbi:MAG: hypothetical protein HC910_18790 [Spirulinaceae cyanobacterium SM2_1_0]|nr:hypothetical protein [Spirulinaceae cyanobacterium SM2_1_0]